jgi:pimeloyl-ACP methyl ester carboxylesterase
MNRHLTVLATVLMLVVAGCQGEPQREAHSRPPSSGTMGPVPSATPGAKCLNPNERAAVIRFRSGNGALIAGVVLGTGHVGVVFAHGNTVDLCDWMPYARVLAGQAYTVLSIDLNGYGASQASAGVPVDPRYDQDLSAAVALLRSRGVPVVFLIGEVVGGTAAVTAATEITPPVAGVVAVSSQAQTSDMDGVAAAHSLKVPLLCIASDIDEFLADTRRIAEAATSAPEHRLLVVTGSSSGETSLFDPGLEPKASEVRAQVAAFLHRYAGPDPTASR